MKQKGFTPILIVILIALAVGGYWLYQKQIPDQTISKLQELCKKKNYSGVALRSVKEINKQHSLISNEDLNETGDWTYLRSARTLCSVITSGASVKKTKESNDKWDYQYTLKNGYGFGYGIIYFQNDWRFILYLPMAL